MFIEIDGDLYNSQDILMISRSASFDSNTNTSSYLINISLKETPSFLLEFETVEFRDFEYKRLKKELTQVSFF